MRSGGASTTRTVAAVFAALGDETRVRIIQRLSTGEPVSIARLREGSDLTRQAITKHLSVLARARLVRDKRLGRERVWRFDGRRIAGVHRFLDRICTEWEDALGHSKRAVGTDRRDSRDPRWTRSRG